MQKEITSRTELLDKDGNLVVCGWARRNLFVYDRERVRRRNRLKEWDFYQASDGDMLVQVNFFNIAIASAATAAVIDMRTGERAECASITLGTVNRLHLPEVSDKPNEFSYSKGGVSLRFVTTENSRKVTFSGKAKGKPLTVELEMEFEPEDENITIVTPFKGMSDRFFLTTKHNCMPCKGRVTYGEKTYEFAPDRTFGVLDWGRGVWPHKNEWYWGNGATYMDGKRFGFEITWKIGDESNATETCLFFRRQGAQDRRGGRGEISGHGRRLDEAVALHLGGRAFRCHYDSVLRQRYRSHRVRAARHEDASGARTVERVRRTRRRQEDRHQGHVRFLRICGERMVTPPRVMRGEVRGKGKYGIYGINLYGEIL